MLVDRASVQEHIYGRTGVATGNFLNNPERFRSKNTKWEFNVEKANQLLEAAGWKKGADGIRAKDGKKLKFVYQTSINTPRQKTQAIVKQACQKAGIDLELKSVTASVFFSSDVANPDTYTQVLLRHPDVHDDHDAARSRAVHEPVHARGRSPPRRTSGRAATSRAGRNDGVRQGCSAAAEGELDPVKRAAMFIRMNDLVCERPGGHPGRLPARTVGASPASCRRRHQRLGQRPWQPEGLVPRSLTSVAAGAVDRIGMTVHGAISSAAPPDRASRASSASASCCSRCWRSRRAIRSRSSPPIPNVPPEVRAMLRAKFGLDDPVYRALLALAGRRCCRATGAFPSPAASTSTR